MPRVPSHWTCPRCRRTFRRVNQRHACGVGRRADVLEGRPADLVKLYGTLETTLKKYGDVEIVARERYMLFRTTRIFADMVFMSDALRLAIHLGREVRAPFFFKIQRGSPHRVSHVAKVRTEGELRVVLPYLQEAYELARREDVDAT